MSEVKRLSTQGQRARRLYTMRAARLLRQENLSKTVRRYIRERFPSVCRPRLIAPGEQG